MEAPCKKSAKVVKLTPSSCLITNLPSLILTEIFCRLPIKTVAACTSVCKSWLLHLLGDPQFSQLHQTKAPTEVCFQDFYDASTSKLYMGTFHSLSNFDPLGVKLDTPFHFPKFRNGTDYFYFANSCNGLLCYYGATIGNRLAVVWNPCTGEFITFPAPKFYKGLSDCHGYGLGFSTKANKYKLLRVIALKENRGFVAEICKIEKTCYWKTVGPCPSALSWPYGYPSLSKYSLYGTFLQGTLHWVGSSDNNPSYISILTFDFEDDQFGEVPLPPNYAKTDSREELGVLAGCLFITDYTDEGVSIWLMKEYGVRDSWTKLFYLRFSIDKRLNSKRCLPIAYMDNGEVLMRSDSFVFFYNPDLKSVRVIGYGCHGFRVIAYRPSVALLKNSVLGYDVHVNPICAYLKHRKRPANPKWWRPVKESPQQNNSKARLTNVELPVAVVVEERQGHVCVSSKFSASESSAAVLTHQQGTEAPATGSGGEGLMQISTSVMSEQETSAAELPRGQGSKTPLEIRVSALREDPLERIKTMMDEVLEELRKEREQRQELEERLRNELAPLKEQTEQLKQQNQQVEERLQHEHAKVKQLEEQIQDTEKLKQENRQMIMQAMDEMRVRLLGPH